MKAVVRIDLTVDTDDYSDVNTLEDVEQLAKEILAGDADLTEFSIVSVTEVSNAT